MRSRSQSDPLIMDCSQSPYNHSEPDSHWRSTFSLSTCTRSPKQKLSCPLCSSWAIIVCLVQLHLKWQRPGAEGRIKDCVQPDTPHTSCQRGCTAFPFFPSSTRLPLCSYVRHKNILSSIQPEVKTLKPLLLFDADSPFKATASSFLCLSRGNYFSALPRGVKVEANRTADETGRKPRLCSLSSECSAKDRRMIFMPARCLPSPAPRKNATCHSRGRAAQYLCACAC